MTLKDLLRKHGQLQHTSTDGTKPTTIVRRPTDRSTSSDTSTPGPEPFPNIIDIDNSQPIPEFTFLRTTTHDQEEIRPPHYPEDDADWRAARRARDPKTPEKQKRRMSIFRSRSGTTVSRKLSTQSERSVKSVKSTKSAKSHVDPHTSPDSSPPMPQGERGEQDESASPRPVGRRRLSERWHLSSPGSRSRASSRASDSSPNLPNDLEDPPDPAPAPLEGPDAKGKVKEYESKETRAKRHDLWERRACRLAMNLHVPTTGPWGMYDGSPNQRRRANNMDSSVEDSVQEAIRLHEAGNLERSTMIFGRLADPRSANSPLSQVLYGLALRHGWGIESSYDLAILYLALAARTSAQIQQASNYTADARGDLVLAMFELGNCYRFGWGCKVDKVAARTFYEVAANLDDPDALEEAAWCFMEGFGGPKDKIRAAQYYRLAECAGRKRVGESWIWKEKYNIPLP